MPWKAHDARRSGLLVPLFWLVAVAAVTLAVVLPRASAVIGGRAVPPPAPYAGFVVQVEGRGFCTGSLIYSQWVVTAGHCLQGAATVRAGSLTRDEGGQVVAIDRSVPGPGDLGLVHLADPVRGVTPIAIATGSPAPGAQASLLGWGQTSNEAGDLPRQLQTLTVPVASPGNCGRFAIDEAHEICIQVTPNSTPCFGDSGGPLVVDGYLVGATSRGGGTCGDGGGAIYSDVAAARDFITGTVNGAPPARVASATRDQNAGGQNAGGQDAGGQNAGGQNG